MTSDLYLILHKVRGEPAFDVAQKVQLGAEDETQPGWLGEVWIIPTSGHRAYPYKMWEWHHLQIDSYKMLTAKGFAIPTTWPDHYAASEQRPQAVARPQPATTTEDFVL